MSLKSGLKSLVEERFFGVFGAIIQSLFFILFVIFGDYSENILANASGLFATELFVVAGFGLIYSFLRKNIFNGFGFNLIILAFGLQWALLVTGFNFSPINKLQFNSMLVRSASYASITVLITQGVLLGKVTPVQLLVIILLETPFYAINKYIGYNVLKVRDLGEAVYMHMFGACFGLIVSRITFKHEMIESRHEEVNSVTDFVSSVGTLLLWLSWPTFHASAIMNDSLLVNRIIVNTVLALLSSTTSSLIAGNILTTSNEKGRFNTAYIQYCLFAGAVSVSAVCDHLIKPWGAILLGAISGILAVVGRKFLSRLLARNGFHDTRGVLFVHGIPSILSALAAVVTSVMANSENYGPTHLTFIFPGRSSRSGQSEAGYHLAVIVITLALSLVSGAFTGLILRFLPGFTFTIHGESVNAYPHHYFNDRMFWVLPQSTAKTEVSVKNIAPEHDHEHEMETKQYREDTIRTDVNTFENVALEQD